MECSFIKEHKRCCCNCKHQIKIFKHPFNAGILSNGQTNQIFGYGCNNPIFRKKNNEIVFFENKHGLCELHLRK